MSNLDLWNRVCKTDPAHTKKVTFGRAITAIDPYRQVENATREFGAAGEGWGWEVKNVQHLSTNELGILVRLWHGTPDKFIEQWGQASLFIDKAEAMKDKDCFKKATTDGITKCLSYLGFNADIFLGKYDDNKYVQDVTQEFAMKPKLDAMNTAYEDNKESVDCVKEALASGDFETAAEAMAELDQEVRLALNVASTKGGIWSLEETALFKSEEYAAARTKYYEDKK